MNELKKTLTGKSIAVRDAPTEIKSRELVPGDIVKLEEGCIVPADGRLVTPKTHLQIDQSALTGESLAVSKTEGGMLHRITDFYSSLPGGHSFNEDIHAHLGSCQTIGAHTEPRDQL